MVRTIAGKTEGAPRGRSFGFDEQNAVGDWGQADVVAYLRRGGRTVVDLSKMPVWQERDIDLQVDQWWVEVKTDLHQPRNLFVETTVGGKPGYVFKTRADYIIYYYPRARLLYWVPVASLAWYVCENRDELVEKVVASRRGRGRTWTAVGLLVPLENLVDAGLVAEFSLEVA